MLRPMRGRAADCCTRDARHGAAGEDQDVLPGVAAHPARRSGPPAADLHRCRRRGHAHPPRAAVQQEPHVDRLLVRPRQPLHCSRPHAWVSTALPCGMPRSAGGHTCIALPTRMHRSALPTGMHRSAIWHAHTALPSGQRTAYAPSAPPVARTCRRAVTGLSFTPVRSSTLKVWGDRVGTVP